MYQYIAIISKLIAVSFTDPNASGGTYNVGVPRVDASSNNLATIVQIVLGVIGSVAVLVIVIASIQLVLSGGNPQSVQRARETILWAVIGLVVVVSAYTIVTFFAGKL
ncbi:MAG: hypothetical protein WCI37_01905 [bacterium]